MTANTTTDADVATPESDTDDNDESTLAWGTTDFRPGGDVGLVARDTIGLVERDNPSTRARLWGLVAADAPLDDILDELSSTGLKALPDFGLAQIEGSAVRIVARGRTTITAELGSGSTREIDPSGVRTWIEELVDDVVALTITLSTLDDDAAAPGGEAFAVLAGSVPASSLTRRYDASDDHADAAESDAGWTAGGTDAASESDDPPPAAVAQVEAEMVEAPDVDLEMVDDMDESSSSGDSWFQDHGDDGDAADVPPQPAPPDLQPADPQPASPQPPPPGSGPSGPPPGGPDAGGLPPSETPADSTRGPVSSTFDADVGDHDAMAEGRAEGEESQADASNTASPSDGATVYGVLAFSNGERVDIDRTILIGRNPKVAGAVDGGLPHIMKFDGPGQGLSRTHAEIRVEGDEVLIEDLESTNGTEVQLPGQQRRRLRAGEPVVIVSGTLIDFGDELHCTVESAG